MSMILVRRKDDQFQIYSSGDIYKRGKWLGKGEGGILDQPIQYTNSSEIKYRKIIEQENAPEWEYEIHHYE